MSEADRFMRGFTRALARKNKAKQTGNPAEPNSDTGIVKHKAIKRLSDDEYKHFIITKMIAYINKHKEAKL
jgi:hypothetical protein